MAGGPGGVKGGGGVDVEFFPPDTRNLTQRSLRSDRGGAGTARFLMLDFSLRLRATCPRGFWIRGSSHPWSGNPKDRAQWVSSPLREGNFFGW